MKKRFTAAACLLASLFLFAGCSQPIYTTHSPNWHNSTNVTYDSSFKETLTYAVQFENSDLTGLKAEIDSDNSSFVVTTEAIGSYPVVYEGGKTVTYSEVYQLRMERTLSGRFYYEENGTEITAAQFGGTYDKNAENDPNSDFQADDADSIVTEVWFASVNNDNSLRPIRSKQTLRKHSAMANIPEADAEDKHFVYMFNVSTEILYDETCDSAQITYTDAYADLQEEERNVTDYIRKTAVGLSDRTVKDLQKNYSCFDDGELYFMARGLTFAANSSNTVTVLGGFLDRFPSPVTISCSELVNKAVSFTMNGAQVSGEIPAATVSFNLANASPNTGEAPKIWYAQKSEGLENKYRNLPLVIEESYGWGVGIYVFTLKSAEYPD